jgi:3-dehydroquinate dehydratase II
MMKILVIHGAGMNMRGKVQQEIFGTMTLAQYEEHILVYAKELDMAVQFFHSNIEGEVCNALYAAFDGDIDACIINPAGYTTLQGPLRAAIAQMKFPVVEVHLSNPTARGAVSAVQPVCKASVYGFGIAGYRLALQGLQGLVRK